MSSQQPPPSSAPPPPTAAAAPAGASPPPVASAASTQNPPSVAPATAPATGGTSGGGSGDTGDGPSKKQATHGQWRTPPLPFFPSGPHGGAAAPAPAPPPAASVPQGSSAAPMTSLPASSDDYAKALQEAYRRGAEAAAKMGAEAAGSGAAPPMFDFDQMAAAAAATATQTQAQPQQPPQPQPTGVMQSQTPQHGPTQPPAGANSAINSATSCPNLSNLGVNLDIDPTPVSEIKEKLRRQAVLEQAQQQAQQYHAAPPPPPHQAHPHPQEPDPQLVTAQRQAAAAQSAQFPGLSPLQGPAPHPGSAPPPPGRVVAAPPYARSSSMEAMPTAAAAAAAASVSAKPPAPSPPAAAGTTRTGVANPLAPPPPQAAAPAVAPTAQQPQPPSTTTATGVPTPLPLGPMRIPGMPPGAPHPSAPAAAAAAPPGPQMVRVAAPPGAPGVPLGPPPPRAAYAPPPGAARPPGGGLAAPPPPPQPGAAPPPAAVTSAAAAPPMTTPSGVPVPAPVIMQGQPRSVSLPDMSSYAARADAEEAKRRKRLARNRASARLRRLRKKNLVDSYEGEVGVLESSLSKLRAHHWGDGSDHEALLEALSMERGQQNIDASQRKELIQSILAQQREQVANIMECQLENMVLGWFAGREGGGAGGGDCAVKLEDGTTGGVGGGNDEAEQLAKELEDVLRLTPDQKSRLVKATEGVEQERRAIETVDSCLEAMMSHSWLTNAGVEECAEQFMSILNQGQVSKFLLWTDHNSESIDRLDYVRAPPAGAPPQNGPTFVFGMDEAAVGDDPAD